MQEGLKSPDCCPSREATMVEILEARRSQLIEALKKIEDVIKHFKGTSQHEQELLKTIFREGQRPY